MDDLSESLDPALIRETLANYPTGVAVVTTSTEDKFNRTSWRPGILGSPILDGAVSWVKCTFEKVSEAGDAYVVLGRVHAAPNHGSTAVSLAGRVLLLLRGQGSRVTRVTDLSEPRVSLAEAAYRRLRGDIIACRLVPGQRLTEKQLAADTGFSIAPLRDALTRLDHEGLVRTLPRKGYLVAPLTPKSIDDLFVVWGIVGPELIRLGIRHATPEQIATAKAAFEQQNRRPEEGGSATRAMPDIEAVNATFGILAEATGNEYLITLYQRLMGDMSRVGALLLTSDPTALLAEPEEHWVRHILAERDPDEAAAKARRYIDEVHRRAVQAAVRWPSVMSSEVVVPVQH